MEIGEIKQTPTYRYINELTVTFDKNAVMGEPIEIALKAVMEAPIADYLPITAGVRIKYWFCDVIFQSGGHFGAMSDALPGIMNMMKIALEDIK
jgi:hypothetical protein